MKPIEEPNYTQVPNYIMDHLDDFESEAELKVVLVVARKTFGWHKERDQISLSQLVTATGMTRSSVVSGLETAIANGWIERIPDGLSFSYAVVVQKLDQSTHPTSPETRPEPVQKVDQKVVQKVDTQKKELKKERNELFDVLVEVCKADARLNGSTVGKVAAELKAAGYTPDDVRAFDRHWWSWEKRNKPPTVWKVRDEISQVKSGKPNTSPAARSSVPGQAQWRRAGTK